MAHTNRSVTLSLASALEGLIGGLGNVKLTGNLRANILVALGQISSPYKPESLPSTTITNSTSSKTIFAIANWKFGGLMGGILSLITLLCVVGYTLALLNWLLTNIKGMLIRGPVKGT